MAAIGSFISATPVIATPLSLSKVSLSSSSVSHINPQAPCFCPWSSCFGLGVHRKHALWIIPHASSSTAKDSHTRIEGAPSKVLYGDHRDDISNVFIDESTGIVCYRTEHGEVICEGLDEGPHFYPPSGSNLYMPDTRASAILPFFGEGMYEI